MLLIGVAGTELTAQERDWLQHDAVAGVVLFKRNFASRAQVVELAAAIRRRLAATGIDFDARPFVPHVTLLRGLAAPLEPQPVAPIRWPVARVELLASRFDRASHETLAASDLVPR